MARVWLEAQSELAAVGGGADDVGKASSKKHPRLWKSLVATNVEHNPREGPFLLRTKGIWESTLDKKGRKELATKDDKGFKSGRKRGGKVRKGDQGAAPPAGESSVAPSDIPNRASGGDGASGMAEEKRARTDQLPAPSASFASWDKPLSAPAVGQKRPFPFDEAPEEAVGQKRPFPFDEATEEANGEITGSTGARAGELGDLQFAVGASGVEVKRPIRKYFNEENRKAPVAAAGSGSGSFLDDGGKAVPDADAHGFEFRAGEYKVGDSSARAQSPTTPGPGDEKEEEVDDRLESDIRIEGDLKADFGEDICCICDDGGRIIVCDGLCLRAFHGWEDEEGGCTSLGLPKELIKRFEDEQLGFKCSNCLYKIHQCFACSKLGSSDPTNPETQEIFKCGAALCTAHYHPLCVAELMVTLQSDYKGMAVEELADKIKQGEVILICPLHTCAKCQEGGREREGEEEGVKAKDSKEDLLFKCRRCPTAYHARCLPSDLPRQDQGREYQRVWGLDDDDEDEEAFSSCFIYCRRHEIDPDLRTPVRDHLQWPPVPKGQRAEWGNYGAIVSQSLLEPATPMSALRGMTTPATGALGTGQGRLTPGILTPGIFTPGAPLSFLTEEEEIGNLIRGLAAEAATLVTKESVSAGLVRPHIYEHSDSSTRSIPENKLNSLLQAARRACDLKKQGKIVDARRVCPREYLKELDQIYNSLRVFLAPFIHGMRYTSFGRHFTQVGKLKQVVSILQPYIKDGDAIVDFCCGANDFSTLLADELRTHSKRKCRFKNFDIMMTKNPFFFKRTDWFQVTPDDMPYKGEDLVIGLNPPFGVRASLANQFIEKAIRFKPRLLILIVPEETKPLEQWGYDLLWMDRELLKGKAFYLPGSINENGDTMTQWNVRAPPLYLWCRREYSDYFRRIAMQNGHILPPPPPLPQPMLVPLFEESVVPLMNPTMAAMGAPPAKRPRYGMEGPGIGAHNSLEEHLLLTSSRNAHGGDYAPQMGGRGVHLQDARDYLPQQTHGLGRPQAVDHMGVPGHHMEGTSHYGGHVEGHAQGGYGHSVPFGEVDIGPGSTPPGTFTEPGLAVSQHQVGHYASRATHYPQGGHSQHGHSSYVGEGGYGVEPGYGSARGGYEEKERVNTDYRQVREGGYGVEPGYGSARGGYKEEERVNTDYRQVREGGYGVEPGYGSARGGYKEEERVNTDYRQVQGRYGDRHGVDPDLGIARGGYGVARGAYGGEQRMEGNHRQSRFSYGDARGTVSGYNDLQQRQVDEFGFANGASQASVHMDKFEGGGGYGQVQRGYVEPQVGDIPMQRQPQWEQYHTQRESYDYQHEQRPPGFGGVDPHAHRELPPPPPLRQTFLPTPPPPPPQNVYNSYRNYHEY